MREARVASRSARLVATSPRTSARLLPTIGSLGLAFGRPCTVVLISPALPGTLVVALAPLMPCASWRMASLPGSGASVTGELLVAALGTPWLCVLISPALGGRSLLPLADVLWAWTPAAANRPASRTGR